MTSKWLLNDLQAQKQLQILKAQAFSFPMIYIMSECEKIDFMAFFDVRALKWLQNGPEGLQLINYIKTVSMVKLEKILKLPPKN